MFDDLLRRLSLDVTGLSDRLRTLLYDQPLPRVVTSVTLAAGATTASVAHGLGRMPVAVFASPSSPVALGVTSTETLVQLEAASGPSADVRVTLVVY